MTIFMSATSEFSVSMSDPSSSEVDNHSSIFQYEIRSQLDMLVFLVALIGVAITLGPAVELLVGLVCAGIAVITLGRLYNREFR
jgi:hypothetical protein